MLPAGHFHLALRVLLRHLPRSGRRRPLRAYKLQHSYSPAALPTHSPPWFLGPSAFYIGIPLNITVALQEHVLEWESQTRVSGIDVAAPMLEQLTLSARVGDDHGVSVLAPMADNVSWHCRYGSNFMGLGDWTLERVSLVMSPPARRHPPVLHIQSFKHRYLISGLLWTQDNLAGEVEKHLQMQVAADLCVFDLELHLAPLGHVYGAVVFFILEMHTYLSADSVAVFVLGHLAVRASGPTTRAYCLLGAVPARPPGWAGHHHRSLCAGQRVVDASSPGPGLPGGGGRLRRVQVILGGQTAAGGQPATMLIFLSGSFKYAGRTYCLYSARPAYIREYSQLSLARTLWKLKRAAEGVDSKRTSADELFSKVWDSMHGEVPNMDSLFYEDAMEIMSVDAPSNTVESILARDFLPSMLEKFQSTLCLRKPYEHVGRKLVKCYDNFYTKSPLLRFYEVCAKIFHLSYGIENLVILLITGILCLTAICWGT
uniref:Uncharacterized protein n=1 Tax=Aegilops tauschii TaxID=37682 RepID=N1QUK4_AEGTA